jgi:hypothetical protein
MKLKVCPKCGGTVSMERDSYGHYIHCLICGWERDLTPVPPLPKNTGRQLKNVRSENVRAPDTGCSVALSCFECPLPDCQFEVPSAREAYLKDKATLAVFMEHRHLGTKVAAELTAQAVGTSDRNVHRVLKRAKSKN